MEISMQEICQEVLPGSTSVISEENRILAERNLYLYLGISKLTSLFFFWSCAGV
jgi:hypothetical protein